MERQPNESKSVVRRTERPGLPRKKVMADDAQASSAGSFKATPSRGDRTLGLRMQQGSIPGIKAYAVITCSPRILADLAPFSVSHTHTIVPS